MKRVALVLVGVTVAVLGVLVLGFFVAIPTPFGLIERANQASAVRSLRLIGQMQAQYAAHNPSRGYACSLAALADPSAGVPDPSEAEFRKTGLANGSRNGYVFAVTNCTGQPVNGTVRVTAYEVTAVPAALGNTGTQGYCATEKQTITADPDGGDHCTQPID